MAKTEKEPAKILISYSGSVSTNVDFGILRFQRHKQWERDVKKAAKWKKEKPLKPSGIREDSLFLKAGATAEVTQVELDYLKKDRPEVFRFIVVHPGTPKVPRSMKTKVTEKKTADGGEVSGKKTRKVKPK